MDVNYRKLMLKRLAKKFMKSKFLKNVITGFGGQLIAIILGLVVPRLIIKSYGSDVNGLLGTITQVFTYIALLEAGIGQSAKNALYKPVTENDRHSINKILAAAEKYFRKLSYIYILGVLGLAILLPFTIKTNINYWTVFFITIFEGLSGAISFYFIQTPTLFLSVDGKNYINNAVNLIDKTIGYAVKIFMAVLGINIIVLQLAYFVISILKAFFYRVYLRKRYGWLSMKEKTSISLPDRNSYVLTEIAWTIFSSTDMIVLSTFLSTKMSSVYSVNNMIFTNLNVLLNSVFYSVAYLIGYAYHESLEKYEKVHDGMNSIFLGLMTVFMSISYLLIIPFINLYTSGVSDVNYIYPSLPLFFCLIQILSWSRFVSGQLTGIAGYAKSTSYVSLVEAFINLSLSIILVKKYGIVGVTIATVVALPLKVIWCTYIADKKVMHRSFKKSFSILGINYLFFFAVVVLSKYFNPVINSYGLFFLWGIILSVVLGIIGMGLNFLVNKDCWQIVRKYILKR